MRWRRGSFATIQTRWGLTWAPGWTPGWSALRHRPPSTGTTYTSFAVWASRHVPGTSSVAGLLKFPGVDDPRELEHWNPKLKLIREILLTREPEIAEYPTAVRLYNRLMATSTTLSRKGTIVLHYRF